MNSFLIQKTTERVGLACALLWLSGCALQPFDHVRTEDTSIEFETGPITAVDLTTFNGSVEVTTHDAASIDMRVTYKAYGQSEQEAQANCEALDHSVEAVGDGLRVQATKPAGRGSASVSFELVVPQDCELTLSTSNGPLSVRDLMANVDLKTSNGRVTLEDVVGTIQAKTSNGTIEVTRCTGGIDLDTSNGKVLYSGYLVGVDNKIKTSNGRVSLELPEELSTEVQCRTSNGSIQCTLEKQRVIEEEKRSFHAVVGSGSEHETTQLSVRTSNGSITIDPYQKTSDATDTEPGESTPAEEQVLSEV